MNNVLKLLSIPMITDKHNESIYNNTREWISSTMNEYQSDKDKWSEIMIMRGLTDPTMDKYGILRVILEQTGYSEAVNPYLSMFLNCEQFIDIRSENVRQLIQKKVKTELEGHINCTDDIKEKIMHYIQDIW